MSFTVHDAVHDASWAHPALELMSCLNRVVSAFCHSSIRASVPGYLKWKGLEKRRAKSFDMGIFVGLFVVPKMKQ